MREALTCSMSTFEHRILDRSKIVYFKLFEPKSLSTSLLMINSIKG